MVDQDLILHQRRLRDPVAGLDQGGVFGTLGGGDAGDALKELTNRHRVGGVIRARSITFSTSFSPMTLAVSWMPPVPQP